MYAQRAGITPEIGRGCVSLASEARLTTMRGTKLAGCVLVNGRFVLMSRRAWPAPHILHGYISLY